MKITLQGTGRSPVTHEALSHFEIREKVDPKRSIQLTVITVDNKTWPFTWALTYETEWAHERPYCFVGFAVSDEDLAGAVRQAAKTILPPGAGYPATEAFEARQERLRGQLEVASLTALTTYLRAST